MNDFATINEIIESSIKSSSINSVLISSGVFIVYTITSKLIDYFKAKDKNRPIIEMGNAIKEISSNVAKLNAILDKVFQDDLKRETIKCKNAIESAFINYQSKLEHTCRDIINNNNIEINKELIVANISQTVNTEYYKIHSILSLYEIDGESVSSHLKRNWIEETIKDLITIIYNGQDSKSRITQIVNKLTITTNNYSTYVYNKTFND